jgi:DNA primase
MQKKIRSLIIYQQLDSSCSNQGTNYWYYSPFRNETQPSFKVNERLNVWYDHGMGEGGTILDLSAKLYQCSIHDFARRL